jgi:hypothetical protein
VDGREQQTSIASAIAVGSQTVKPESMEGITVGSILAIDSGTNQEIVTVAGVVPGSTVTTIFAKAHAAGAVVLFPKTQPPYRFTLDTGRMKSGSHTLAVAAYDGTAKPTYSAPLPVTKGSAFETCDGQPYDQLLPFPPNEKPDNPANPEGPKQVARH